MEDKIREEVVKRAAEKFVNNVAERLYLYENSNNNDNAVLSFSDLPEHEKQKMMEKATTTLVPALELVDEIVAVIGEGLAEIYSESK